MEEIYPPESYGASNRFPLKEYFDEFGRVFVTDTPISAQTDDDINETEYLLEIKELMGVEMSFNDIKHLSDSCSIDLLTCEGENTKVFPIEIPENINSSSKLPSTYVTSDENNLAVNKCRQELEMQKNPMQLCLGNKRSYHKRIEFPIPATPPDLEPGSDFLISILIHKPIAFKFFNAKNASEKLRFNHEIVALGQNTLAELRDTIICSSDFGLCKEVESTSDDLRELADARVKVVHIFNKY
jgi:hypothetical protein